MEIEFTGRQMEVPTDLRKYTDEHLGKLTKLLQGRFALHVVLTAERHRRVAELTLKFRDHSLVGVGDTSDARSSVKEAVDKLERQVLRLVERRRTRKRRPSPTSAILLNVLSSESRNHEHRPVLETERIALKPLSVEEAVEALESTQSGVVVFRNRESERVNVVYRRPDRRLGLIEPES